MTSAIKRGATRGIALSPPRHVARRLSEGWTGITVAVVVLAASFTLAGCSAHNDTSESALSGDRRAVRSASDAPASAAGEGRDYDPWESLNERTFWFNYDVLDRYGLKPAAKLWNRVIPEPVTEGLANAFDNLDMPKRFVNDVLQGRLEGANRQLTRFVVNSTVGVAGFFDVATRLGWEAGGADMGQTLGTYGIGPGPYLIVPFMYPFTVRDAIGYAFDTMLDPIGFIAPFAATFARSATRRVNERARNVETYEQVEEASLDIYAAVRNAYLQRRAQSVSDAIRERDRETELMWHSLRRMLFIGDDDAGDDGKICRDATSRTPARSCSQPAAADIIR